MKSALPIVLSVLAGICFGYSFFVPFVCSNFHLEHQVLQDSTEIIDDPCTEIFDTFVPRIQDLAPSWVTSLPGGKLTKGLAEKVCDGYAGPKVQQYAYGQLDKYLGGVEIPPSNQMVGWEECIVQETNNSLAETSCCDPQEEQLNPMKSCLKYWISSRANIPLGEQKIVAVIQQLYQMGETRIAVLLLFFSVLFPLTKVLSAFVCAVGYRPKWLLSFLLKTGKWSMVDVFVVGLIIAFFRADSFAFGFTAEIGVYLFAIGAILSSVAAMLLDE